MVSEIEKQFFEAFGIKPKTYLLCTSGWDCIDAQPCEQCGYSKLIEDEYPKITYHILLELICKTEGLIITQNCNSVEQLKDGVLKVLINLAQVNNDIKHQVQELFTRDK